MNNFLSKRNVLGIFLLLLGLFVGLVLVRQTQLFRKKAAVTPSATLSFSLLTTTTYPVGSTVNIEVNTNTGGQPIVAGDILVKFDPSVLELTNIAKSTNTSSATFLNIFKTFAPVTTSGTFDTARVVACAKGTAPTTTPCPSGAGVVEFGFVAFDWTANTTTGTFSSQTNTPVATLSFLVKSAPASGSTVVRFIPTSATPYNEVNTTVDSNIVVSLAGSLPGDILVTPSSFLTVAISSTQPSPTPTLIPSIAPSNVPPTPTPAPISSNLISNLVVYDTTPINNAAYWSIQTNIQGGDIQNQYGDRAYTLSSVPTQVAGSDWIRTAAASKTFTANPLATFKVNQNSTVYIAHTNKATTKPTWLSTSNNWTNTGLTITNSEAPVNTFTLYSKQFLANQTVSLGPNTDSGDTNAITYTVIVKQTPAIVASPTPACVPTNGDANNDGRVSLIDFNAWLQGYSLTPTTTLGPSVGDFNCDSFVRLLDFNIWLSHYPS